MDEDRTVSEPKKSLKKKDGRTLDLDKTGEGKARSKEVQMANEAVLNIPSDCGTVRHEAINHCNKRLKSGC